MMAKTVARQWQDGNSEAYGRHSLEVFEVHSFGRSAVTKTLKNVGELCSIGYTGMGAAAAYERLSMRSPYRAVPDAA